MNAGSVAISGAGVMGLVTALWLKDRGWNVRLFEKSSAEERSASSFVAAGMISPWAELESADGSIHELGKESLSLWPRVLKASGAERFFTQRGSLILAHPRDRAELEHFRSKLNVAGIEALDAQGIESLEPELQGFDEALFLPQEAWIDAEAFLACAREKLKQDTQYGAGEELSGGAFDWHIDCRGMGAKKRFLHSEAYAGKLFCYTLRKCA